VMMEIWDNHAIKIGIGTPSESWFVYLVLDAEIYMRGSCDDFNEEGICGLVVVNLKLEIGSFSAMTSTMWERTVSSPAITGNTPSCHSVTIMTTLVQGGALHVAMFLEVCCE